MNSNIKTAIFWVVLICLAVLLWTIVRQGKQGTEDQIKFTDFIDQVKDRRSRMSASPQTRSTVSI